MAPGNQNRSYPAFNQLKIIYNVVSEDVDITRFVKLCDPSNNQLRMICNVVVGVLGLE